MNQQETPRAKFNQLIGKIEELSRIPDTSADDIAECVSHLLGFSKRDASTIMRFCIGQTLLEYIKQRKIMAAYQCMMESPKFQLDDALAVSGYDNQQSFTKCFSQTFKVSPQKAYDQKLQHLYQQAISWDRLPEHELPHETKERPVLASGEQKFGISRQDYERIRIIQEQEELYGMPSEYSDIVFDFVKKFKVANNDIKYVFEYVSQWKRIVAEYRAAESEEERLEHVKRMAFDTDYIQLCLNAGLSVDLALRTIDRIPENIDLKTLPLDFLYELGHTVDMDFSYFATAYRYFQNEMEDHPREYEEDDALSEFMERLNCGMPMESAIRELPTDLSDLAAYPDPREEEILWRLEAEEEKRFAEEFRWDGERFDMEPDMDNLAYEDD